MPKITQYGHFTRINTYLRIHEIPNYICLEVHFLPFHAPVENFNAIYPSESEDGVGPARTTRVGQVPLLYPTSFIPIVTR